MTDLKVKHTPTPATPVDLTLEHVSGDGMIITHTGKWFDVFNPNPDDVDIEDIAHALANQCRFTGHTRTFYSVAQHSVYVAENCPSEHALQGLLHDASEAYLSDIARPIKKHPEFGPFYLGMERKLSEAIYTKFDLPLGLAEEIKEADNLLLRTEARDFMPATFPVYPGRILPKYIHAWEPDKAKRFFVVKFLECF